MATAPTLTSRVSEITTCPICLEDFQRPKSLPCVHTFCLRCLQRYYKDKLPYDEVQCPLCRNEFRIPRNGLEELPSNFFLQHLIDAKDLASSDKRGEVLCEVCQVKDEDGSNIPLATEYCVDCNQKLCESCSRPHKVWRGGAHKVTPLGAEVTTELGSYCEEHPDEKVKLYCFDCKDNVCLMCTAIAHKTHNCKEVGKVAADIKTVMDADIQTVLDGIASFQTAEQQVDKENSTFLEAVTGMGKRIDKRVETVEQVLSDQGKCLRDELESIKCETEKEAMARKDKIQLALTAMQSFTVHSSELRTKGSPSDIARSADELHSRAQELLRTYTTPDEFNAPLVSFHPPNIDELTKDGGNMVGRIEKTSNSCRDTAVPVCRIPTVSNQAGINKDEKRKLEEQLVKYQAALQEGKVREHNLLARLNASQKRERMSQAADKERIARMQQRYTTSAFSTLRSLEIDADICGLTSANHQLYVLCMRVMNKLDVYSMPALALVKRLNVVGLKNDASNDMTSLGGNVYISDYKNKCIHKLDSKNDSARKIATLSESPSGLSVSKANSLLVACQDADTLRELSTDGVMLREVDLYYTADPIHALKLRENNFVLCHRDRDKHRVCEIDSTGTIIHCYGNQRGSRRGQLDGPTYLAVDKAGFVFVADAENGRALLLNPSLEFVRCVASRGQELSGNPHHLYLDHTTKCLYVSQATTSVVQIQL